MRSDLMEGSLVPILLEEPLLAFRFFLSKFVGTFDIFLHSLFLGHCTSSLDLLALFLTPKFLLFLLLDSLKFPETPSLKLSLWIEPVGIIYVRDDILFLLYIRRKILNADLRMNGHTLCQLSPDAFCDQIMAFLLALFSSDLFLLLHLFRFLNNSVSLCYGHASASVGYVVLLN